MSSETYEANDCGHDLIFLIISQILSHTNCVFHILRDEKWVERERYPNNTRLL
jgi:hypothetical protein